MKKITKNIKPKTFLVVLAVFIVATVLVNVQASTLSASIRDYQAQADLLTEQVEVLESEVVELSSLSDKLEKTEELGLSQPKNVFYLKQEEAFASR